MIEYLFGKVSNIFVKRIRRGNIASWSVTASVRGKFTFLKNQLQQGEHWMAEKK